MSTHYAILPHHFVDDYTAIVFHEDNYISTSDWCNSNSQAIRTHLLVVQHIADISGHSQFV